MGVVVRVADDPHLWCAKSMACRSNLRYQGVEVITSAFDVQAAALVEQLNAARSCGGHCHNALVEDASISLQEHLLNVVATPIAIGAHCPFTLSKFAVVCTIADQLHYQAATPSAPGLFRIVCTSNKPTHSTATNEQLTKSTALEPVQVAVDVLQCMHPHPRCHRHAAAVHNSITLFQIA
jgi:hypothetical protein